MSRGAPASRSARDARESVSEATAGRLSVYLRCIAVLEAEGATNISSQGLARRFRLSSAQIRKDLATFGEFGTRGVGYEIDTLKRHLVTLLGLDRTRRVAIIGAGRLGQALADYGGFGSGGFRIVALFDNDRGRIGSRSRSGIPIYDVRRLGEIVARERVEIAVITVPASEAMGVARECWTAGLKAVLNFAPVRLDAPPDSLLKNVDLKINLETLSFYMTRGTEAFRELSPSTRPSARGRGSKGEAHAP